MIGMQKITGGMRLAICAALVWCLLMNPVCMAQETVPELIEPAGVNLDTATAYIGDISQIVLFHGQVTPHVESLHFPVDGVIAEVNVVCGQRVVKGDVLYTLDCQNQESQLESLQSQFESLRVEQNYTKQLADLERAMLEVELRELMVISSEDQNAIDLKRLDIEQLEEDLTFDMQLLDMQVNRIQNELASLKEEITETQICAPFDGTIMFLKDVHSGMHVSAYEPLVYLADETRLSITTEYVSEAVLNAANEYYALIGANKYDIMPVELENEDYFAKIQTGETIRSEFLFASMDDTIKAGMYAAICMKTKEMRNVLLVPRNAVYTDANGSYVYALENDERIRRDVRLGTTTDCLAAITEGLEEGAVVYVKE